MSMDETVSFKLEIDASRAADDIRELNRLLTTYVALARRVGIPENIMEGIRRLQQLRIAIETTYRSLWMLYAASGPIGWITALGGLALGGLMLADQMELERHRY